jgi:hypothetical protein
VCVNTDGYLKPLDGRIILSSTLFCIGEREAQRKKDLSRVTAVSTPILSLFLRLQWREGRAPTLWSSVDVPGLLYRGSHSCLTNMLSGTAAACPSTWTDILCLSYARDVPVTKPWPNHFYSSVSYQEKNSSHSCPVGIKWESMGMETP